MHQLPPVPVCTFQTEPLGSLRLLFYGFSARPWQLYPATRQDTNRNRGLPSSFLSPLSPCNQPSISHFQDAPSQAILSLSIAPILPQVWWWFLTAPQPSRVLPHRAGEGSCADDKAAPLKSGEVCVLTALTSASHCLPGRLLQPPWPPLSTTPQA